MTVIVSVDYQFARDGVPFGVQPSGLWRLQDCHAVCINGFEAVSTPVYSQLSYLFTGLHFIHHIAESAGITQMQIFFDPLGPYFVDAVHACLCGRIKQSAFGQLRAGMVGCFHKTLFYPDAGGIAASHLDQAIGFFWKDDAQTVDTLRSK